MITCTHTKTFALMHAWASTIPWDCLIRETNCCSPDHKHDPMANDECAVEDCDRLLLVGEECYAVTELPGQDENGRIPWVCWRHVRPDDGPVGIHRNPRSGL